MSKAGSTKRTVTAKEKDFAGTGVEGQKGAGAKQDDKADTKPATPAGDNAKQEDKADTNPAPPAGDAAKRDDKVDTPAPAAEKAPAFDTTGATYTITHRHGGPKKVWFRDGKEIGVEDAG